jgi:hypothetical protein
MKRSIVPMLIAGFLLLAASTASAQQAGGGKPTGPLAHCGTRCGRLLATDAVKT